jgi:hypothetical protein
LVARTGARTLAPLLAEWRAEASGALDDEVGRQHWLHEAARGYAELGVAVQEVPRDGGSAHPTHGGAPGHPAVSSA